MEELRDLGNRIKYIADEKGISVNEISNKTGQPLEQIYFGLTGRKMFSFPQLEEISDVLGVSVDAFFDSESDKSLWYVDCMNEFTKKENRENILDIIYDYLDVLDSVKNQD